MLPSQFLHKSDGFTLIHDELLIPRRREVLKLCPVLLLDLYFFTRMLINQGNLEAGLGLLSDFDDSGELVLGRSEITVSLIYYALSINGLAM